MKRLSQKSIRSPAHNTPRPTGDTREDPKATRANPEEFGKETSPVRERLTRQMKEMSPEERLRQGP